MATMTDEENLDGEKTGFFSRLKKGLLKTRDNLAGGIDNVVRGAAKVGPELMLELEEVLLMADVGMPATTKIIAELKAQVKDSRIRSNDEVTARIKEIMAGMLGEFSGTLDVSANSPFVVLVIGVNGSGKTTTIGKLAKMWRAEGKSLALAAGDTFRAAAVEQLQVWADRAGVDCIRQKSGADPSAVAYDAVHAAIAKKMDVVIVDTAGRLQTNQNLMEELKKIKRVMAKALPGAPHETLLVLDASIGQNSVSQAKLFHEALGVDGLVMTKLDGTGKGGVLLNITHELRVPVRFIGVGEKAEDLQVFSPQSFVRALFEK